MTAASVLLQALRSLVDFLTKDAIMYCLPPMIIPFVFMHVSASGEGEVTVVTADGIILLSLELHKLLL